MKLSLCLLASITIALATLVETARCNWTLYSNGPVTLTTTAYTITGPFAVANSFVLDDDATISLINGIGLQSIQGVTPVSFNWSLGTTAFGSEITSATGTTPILNYVGVTSLGYDVFSAVIDTGNINLAAGTYWFTLSGAVSSDNFNEVYWSQTGGLSDAFLRQNLDPPTTIPSEAFTIVGVPEPSTFALLGVALVAFGIAARRRLTRLKPEA